MRNRVLCLLIFMFIGASHAAAAAPVSAEFVGPTPRETLLAAGIAAMMALGLASFFLIGRVAERTHVALALLGVLIGGFCLFALYGLAGHEYPAAGAFVVLGLIGMFKLMNQFEIRRKVGRQEPRHD